MAVKRQNVGRPIACKARPRASVSRMRRACTSVLVLCSFFVGCADRSDSPADAGDHNPEPYGPPRGYDGKLCRAGETTLSQAQYAICIPGCSEDSDCPPLPGGTVMCANNRCELFCETDNDCPSPRVCNPGATPGWCAYQAPPCETSADCEVEGHNCKEFSYGAGTFCVF